MDVYQKHGALIVTRYFPTKWRGGGTHRMEERGGHAPPAAGECLGHVSSLN